MTQDPGSEPTQPFGEDPNGQQPPGQPQYGQPQYGQPQYGQPQYGQPQYGQPPYTQPQYGQYPLQGSPEAPYGVDPRTGLPYSDKQKLIAGLLQILIPLGIGRFYTGHTNLGLAQLLVTIFTCGIGALWPFIDGILTLVGTPTDAQGRPLR